MCVSTWRVHLVYHAALSSSSCRKLRSTCLLSQSDLGEMNVCYGMKMLKLIMTLGLKSFKLICIGLLITVSWHHLYMLRNPLTDTCRNKASFLNKELWTYHHAQTKPYVSRAWIRGFGVLGFSLPKGIWGLNALNQLEEIYNLSFSQHSRLLQIYQLRKKSGTRQRLKNGVNLLQSCVQQNLKIRKTFQKLGFL